VSTCSTRTHTSTNYSNQVTTWLEVWQYHENLYRIIAAMQG
jgi:hypothetical protein